MQPTKYQTLKLSLLALSIVFAGGCVSAKMNPGDKEAMAAPAQPVSAAPAKAMAADASMKEMMASSYTVQQDDNLWCISKLDDIYGTAFNWPLIYKANADQIKDADLIYAGQNLNIPRDSSQSAIDAAVNHAKTRGAWAVGPSEASDAVYLGG